MAIHSGFKHLKGGAQDKHKKYQQIRITAPHYSRHNNTEANVKF